MKNAIAIFSFGMFIVSAVTIIIALVLLISDGIGMTIWLLAMVSIIANILSRTGDYIFDGIDKNKIRNKLKEKIKC